MQAAHSGNPFPGLVLSFSFSELRDNRESELCTWRMAHGSWRKGPGARFRVRNGGFPGFFRDSGPRGGEAAAPALFRTNNYGKNDMA